MVTADHEAGPVALIASSVSSVSVDPPMVMLSVSDHSSAGAAIVAAETFVIHFLDATDVQLALLGAGPPEDRFADPTIWTWLENGEPAFISPSRLLRARTVERVRAGTATVLIAEALDVSRPAHDLQEALVYHDRSWHIVH